MSLSRPATFPLLRLPFLCIECVIKNWKDIFDIICFALTSKRTRRIVKILKIALNRIEIYVLEQKMIKLGSMYKTWSFKTTSLKSLFLRKDPLVLQDNAIPLSIRRTDYGLESFTNGNEVAALKMAMEFLKDLFKCSVEQVDIIDSYFPESFGVKSAGNLFVHYENSLFSETLNQKLMSLLENLEVTGTCKFWVPNPKKDFYVDPKLFKCKNEFSLEEFRTAELNPVPFSERTRVPLSESFSDIDFSQGLEIIRHDGLKATIHVGEENFMFYIWHDQ